MKKIMNGKMYDTDTADLICANFFGETADPVWYTEALFHTKKGAYFLYCLGSASSPYGNQIGENSWEPGEILMAYTEDEAKSFVEKYGTTDEYIEAFGEPEAA